MNDMVKELTKAASYGLYDYYQKHDKVLYYTAKKQMDGYVRPQGYSLRYAAIAHIGISKWLSFYPGDKEKLPELWGEILYELPKINDIGDVALCLWAGCEGEYNERTDIIIDKLISLWPQHNNKCNSVELGWILKACLMVNDVMPELILKLDLIIKESYMRLSSNYNSTARLFYRHHRKKIKQRVHRQIACFADQVYPVVAIAHYGKLFDDKKPLTMISHVVDKICEYQGKQGQWMWHYDVAHSQLCEEYPVFSVHQDAMAPMAIFASDIVNGEDHSEQVELGVRWLFGNNELNEMLVIPEKGVIWRDIERNEPEKRTRYIKGIFSTYGMRPIGNMLTKKYAKLFKTNYECRPYHLGWILYAWAGYEYNISQRNE